MRVLHHIPGPSGTTLVVFIADDAYMRIRVADDKISQYPVGSQFTMSLERVPND